MKHTTVLMGPPGKAESLYSKITPLGKHGGGPGGCRSARGEVVIILVRGEGGLSRVVAGGMEEGDRHDGC